MEYLKLTIHTDENGLDTLPSFLAEHDITDIIINDPRDIELLKQKEHEYDWDYIDDSVLELANIEPTIVLYIEQNEESVEKVSAIKKLLGDLKISIEAEDDANWKDKWKEHFKPAKISDRVIVKPSWISSSDEGMVELLGSEELGLHVIEIDPGMAFGTGTHETTSLCVKMLEKYMNTGDKVLDIGTGSGILAIAAAMLGAEEVLATDIDPIAVSVSKENIELNKQEKIVTVKQSDLTADLSFKADVVVANLMADLVVRLTPQVIPFIVQGGYYISSGILDEKLETVKSAIIDCGFEIVECATDGMWCAIVAVNNKCVLEN